MRQNESWQDSHLDHVFRAAHMASCVDAGDLPSALVGMPDETYFESCRGWVTMFYHPWDKSLHIGDVTFMQLSFFIVGMIMIHHHPMSLGPSAPSQAAYRELPLRGHAARRCHVLDLHLLQPEEAESSFSASGRFWWVSVLLESLENTSKVHQGCIPCIPSFGARC